MKIKSIEVFKIEMPLAMPYTIAYETVTHSTNVILKINTNKGLTAWGCAAPDKFVTGETADEVITFTQQYIEPLIIGQSPFQIQRFLSVLKKQIPKAKATLAMLDIGLHDLLARKAKLPLYQLLGGFRQSIPTSITIGIVSIKETIEQTLYFQKKGFHIIKLKGGLNVEEDIKKVEQIRTILGKSGQIRFDANQGYSKKEAIHFVKATKEANIEILEQPTLQTKMETLGAVTKSVEIPVMADESIKNLNDAFLLVSQKWIDMINIKVMKVGGLIEAEHINSLAKAANMPVMIGCLDECGLAISASLQFALSRPNIHYADLDGHLDLLEDPFTDLFDLKNGVLSAKNTYGLGKVVL